MDTLILLLCCDIGAQTCYIGKRGFFGVRTILYQGLSIDEELKFLAVIGEKFKDVVICRVLYRYIDKRKNSVRIPFKGLPFLGTEVFMNLNKTLSL